MSISTHVAAFRNMDGKMKEMLEVKTFCDDRKVSYPKEVTDFFGGLASESASYIRNEMLEVPTKAFATEHKAEMQEGYNIEVAKIPADVKTIRVWTSF